MKQETAAFVPAALYGKDAAGDYSLNPSQALTFTPKLAGGTAGWLLADSIFI